MPVTEDNLRSALRDLADQAGPSTFTAGPLVRRAARLRARFTTVAVCCGLAIAAAAVTVPAAMGTPAQPSLSSARPAHPEPGFAGYKWRVVAIDHDGKQTPVPARYSVYLLFTPNGQFGANDPVNYHGGTYREIPGGFTTSGTYTTLVGYAGTDPVVLLSINAISSFDAPAREAVTLTGDRLAVTVGGYTLISQRDGKQPNFPPATPSATAHGG